MAANLESVATERIQQRARDAQAARPGGAEGSLQPLRGAVPRGLDAEDVAEREVLDLFGAVLSLWQFARARKPGEPKVRVFNPMVEEHGWQSPHTVIADRQRRHAVPRRLAADGGAAPRPDAAFHRASDRHACGAMRRAGGSSSSAGKAEGGARESLMHVEVDRIVDAAQRNELAASILRVLGDVRVAVDRLEADAAKMAQVSAELEAQPAAAGDAVGGRGVARVPRVARRQPLHVRRLPRARSRRHADGAGLARRQGIRASGLLRETSDETLSPSFMHAAGAAARACTRSATCWSSPSRTGARPCTVPAISTTSASSATTRTATSSGEHRFLGLYTSTAYSANPADIPLLRRKVARVFERARIPARKPRGQDACEHPRHLSARRAFPDRRGRAGANRARHPQARRPPAACGCSCAIDLYERFVSCLDLRARAIATRPSCGCAGRRSSSRRSTARARSSRCCSPSRRWCAC